MKSLLGETGLRWLLPLALVLMVLGSNSTFAQDAGTEAASADDATDGVEAIGALPEVEAASIPVDFIVHNLWIMIAGMLVFVMHLGFATLESGLTQSKNTVNILFKNSMIICIGFLTYLVVGFNLMYPGFEDAATGFFKFAGFGFMMNGPVQAAEASFSSPVYNPGYTAFTDFFFQAMFAATCATIVSG
ncbi:MAG: hypothetical protein ABGZ23_21925, partial [Fuerstiella sp.]